MTLCYPDDKCIYPGMRKVLHWYIIVGPAAPRGLLPMPLTQLALQRSLLKTFYFLFFFYFCRDLFPKLFIFFICRDLFPKLFIFYLQRSLLKTFCFFIFSFLQRSLPKTFYHQHQLHCWMPSAHHSPLSKSFAHICSSWHLSLLSLSNIFAACISLSCFKFPLSNIFAS